MAWLHGMIGWARLFLGAKYFCSFWQQPSLKMIELGGLL
jgi:hypothetical protein